MTPKAPTTRRVVAGIGMSSAATATEVAATLDDALAQVGLQRRAVATIATRDRFADDPRLAFGVAVVGVDDDLLLRHAPTGSADRPGLPARVSAAAAEIVGGGLLLDATVRSAHVTVSLVTVDEGARP